MDRKRLLQTSVGQEPPSVGGAIKKTHSNFSFLFSFFFLLFFSASGDGSAVSPVPAPTCRSLQLGCDPIQLIEDSAPAIKGCTLLASCADGLPSSSGAKSPGTCFRELIRSERRAQEGEECDRVSSPSRVIRRQVNKPRNGPLPRAPRYRNVERGFIVCCESATSKELALMDAAQSSLVVFLLATLLLLSRRSRRDALGRDNNLSRRRLVPFKRPS